MFDFCIILTNNFFFFFIFFFFFGVSDSVDLVHDNDSMMVQTPQSLQGNPGGGGEVGGSYHGNPSASRTPVNSTPSSLDSQTQTNANLYGDQRDYSSPVALDHMPSPWQHHLNQHAHFSPGPTNTPPNQQDRSFKTEPEHAGEFPHAANRSESVVVNEADRVSFYFILFFKIYLINFYIIFFF